MPVAKLGFFASDALERAVGVLDQEVLIRLYPFGKGPFPLPQEGGNRFAPLCERVPMDLVGVLAGHSLRHPTQDESDLLALR